MVATIYLQYPVSSRLDGLTPILGWRSCWRFLCIFIKSVLLILPYHVSDSSLLPVIYFKNNIHLSYISHVPVSDHFGIKNTMTCHRYLYWKTLSSFKCKPTTNIKSRLNSKYPSFTQLHLENHCHHHHHHHHIRFYVHFTCWHALDGFQKIDFRANLSLARSLLTLLSLKSIFITSSQVFFGLPLHLNQTPQLLCIY